MYKLPTNLKLLALALLISAGAQAQTRDQPIQIEANQAEYSDRTGISTYTGNVVLTQGSLVLTGSTLTVTRNQDSGSIEAVLVGEPATLAKAADADNAEPVDGRAQRMEYQSGAAVVTLKGNAYVKRGGDAISGEIIKHDLNSARTEAQSSGGERVKITIQPDSAEAAAPAQGQAPAEPAPEANSGQAAEPE